jgi:hypothetical protein
MALLQHGACGMQSNREKRTGICNLTRKWIFFMQWCAAEKTDAAKSGWLYTQW